MERTPPSHLAAAARRREEGVVGQLPSWLDALRVRRGARCVGGVVGGQGGGRGAGLAGRGVNLVVGLGLAE